jgi:hypothetical protein
MFDRMPRKRLSTGNPGETRSIPRDSSHLYNASRLRLELRLGLLAFALECPDGTCAWDGDRLWAESSHPRLTEQNQA